MRLPEDGFPFAGVTALLRHTFFRPRWPELDGCPEMPQLAEALLRLLGEPRGREAYLAAVERWAEREQPGLEDEAAEESRRKKIHELAGRCLPFLQRFFRAWDEAPERASPGDHVAWLHRFADDLGIIGARRTPTALPWTNSGARPSPGKTAPVRRPGQSTARPSPAGCRPWRAAPAFHAPHLGRDVSGRCPPFKRAI